jgi:hypothetical protein
MCEADKIADIALISNSSHNLHEKGFRVYQNSSYR